MSRENIEQLFAGEIDFDWDDDKAALNLRKHGIDFEEATAVFYRPHLLQRSDRNKEERWIVVGDSDGRLIAVVFTRRLGTLRIISARRARRNEERTYHDQEVGRSPPRQD